jgi:ketose-bisphosphate aldolase
MLEIIQKAQKGKYAIGAFNVDNTETIEGVLAGAEAERSPVILSVSPVSLKYTKLANLAALAKAAIEDCSVPAFLHLDHGMTFEQTKETIAAGFSSVMIDGAELSLEENTKLTKTVCDYAHSKNVIVEGALGHIVTGLSGQAVMCTYPEEVSEFAEGSLVDVLAISIGNVHGLPGSPMKFDLERLAKIASITDVPLALHGGSFTPKDTMRTVIETGICKVNIGTAIRVALMTGIGECLPKELTRDNVAKVPFQQTLKSGKDRLIAEVRDTMRTLGSSNKA